MNLVSYEPFLFYSTLNQSTKFFFFFFYFLIFPAQLDIELPINFQITNPAIPTLSTHGGVLEFIAAEGTVNLPQWVSISLSLSPLSLGSKKSRDTRD